MVADYYFEGCINSHKEMAVEQSYEKALGWYNHILERFQDKETIEKVKKCKKELGK